MTGFDASMLLVNCHDFHGFAVCEMFIEDKTV